MAEYVVVKVVAREKSWSEGCDRERRKKEESGLEEGGMEEDRRLKGKTGNNRNPGERV